VPVSDLIRWNLRRPNKLDLFQIQPALHPTHCDALLLILYHPANEKGTSDYRKWVYARD
jgi:hypothetical protein